MTKPKGYCPRCGGQDIFVCKALPYKGASPRMECRGCRSRFKTAAEFPPDEFEIKTTMDTSGLQRFIITSAQNDTPVHREFFRNLVAYAEHIKARLIVIPIRYRNPTSRFEDQKSTPTWTPDVIPYLFEGRLELNDSVVVLGDIKTQPTAARPLSGFETISGHRSAIIGHPKLALECIPTPAYRLPKIVTTTGSVTRANYSDTKAGKKGDFHHTYGASVVEIASDEKFFLRHINAARNGSFIDLTYEVRRGEVREAPAAEALVMGDTHAIFHDPEVDEATFGEEGGMVSTLRPKFLVWHDVLDFYSGSHHHQRDPFIRLAKRKSARDCVASEVKYTIDFVLDRTKMAGATSIIVPSNHLDHLARWVRETDWRDDPGNAIFYLKTALFMAENTHMGEASSETPDPFVFWIRERGKDARAVLTPRRDESYRIAGIEVNYHGDRGPGGSRGSIQSYRKIGAKTIIGHSHTPGILDGCYQVGTSSRLRLEYNSGPSSWMQTHCVIYANGKRSLLHIIGGEWKL